MNNNIESIIEFFSSRKKETIEHDLAVSEWFSEEDISSGLYDDAQDEYYELYEHAVDEIIAKYGVPQFNDGMAAKNYPQWYESMFLAFWPESNGCRYIALRHDDEECPFAVVYGFKNNIDM